MYGVTTKSERHKRSYWTRTADGNGIGGRKAPVPYGSRWIPGCQQPTHGPREERNDDTGACPTEYQATRDERPDAYPDSKGTGRFVDDRGQVRDPRLFARSADRGNCEPFPRSRASTRARPTNGSRPTGACRANSGTPPGACTSGSWRNAASRAVIRRCGDGSSAGANATAARPRGPASWNGRRAARRSISVRPWPWSPAWNGPCILWWSRSRTRT